MTAGATPCSTRSRPCSVRRPRWPTTPSSGPPADVAATWAPATPSGATRPASTGPGSTSRPGGPARRDGARRPGRRRGRAARRRRGRSPSCWPGRAGRRGSSPPQHALPVALAAGLAPAGRAAVVAAAGARARPWPRRPSRTCAAAGPPPVRAVPDGDGWRVDGHVGWLTSWGLADVLLLGARAGDDLVLGLVPPATRDGPGGGGADAAGRDAGHPHDDAGPGRLPAGRAATCSTWSRRDVWLAADAARTANVVPAVFGLLASLCRRPRHGLRPARGRPRGRRRPRRRPSRAQGCGRGPTAWWTRSPPEEQVRGAAPRCGRPRCTCSWPPPARWSRPGRGRRCRSSTLPSGGRARRCSTWSRPRPPRSARRR